MVIVKEDPCEPGVDALLELLSFEEAGSEAYTVPEIYSLLGEKERLIDGRTVQVDHQAVEAHQMVDGPLPFLTHSKTFVQLTNRQILEDHCQHFHWDSIHFL